MTETKEITIQHQSPNAMIQLALSQGQDLERLERLLELQIRYDENEAKKAYHQAMAKFKGNLPPVFKDKENKQYNSMYASESALLNTINPELSKYGLVADYDFPESGDPKFLKVSCVITHALGYSKTVTLPGPLDTSGSKNPLQQVKSTVTYLRKATFEAATGIATTDKKADDDGNTAGDPEYIDDKQLGQIVDMINAKNIDQLQFSAYMNVEKAENILKRDFSKAMIALKKAKGRTREPGSDDN